MLVPAYFNALAETIVVWGRSLTTAETNTLSSLRDTLAVAGVQFSGPVNASDSIIYYWSSVDAANQWASTCNGFTPAPTSVVVNNPPQPLPAQSHAIPSDSPPA